MCLQCQIYVELMSFFSWDTEEDAVTFFLEKLDCNHIKALNAHKRGSNAPIPGTWQSIMHP